MLRYNGVGRGMIMDRVSRRWCFKNEQWFPGMSGSSPPASVICYSSPANCSCSSSSLTLAYTCNKHPVSNQELLNEVQEGTTSIYRKKWESVVCARKLQSISCFCPCEKALSGRGAAAADEHCCTQRVAAAVTDRTKRTENPQQETSTKGATGNSSLVKSSHCV